MLKKRKDLLSKKSTLFLLKVDVSSSYPRYPFQRRNVFVGSTVSPILVDSEKDSQLFSVFVVRKLFSYYVSRLRSPMSSRYTPEFWSGSL